MKKIPAILAMLLLTGCYNDTVEELYPKPTSGCDTTTVTFNADILPIVSASCALTGCHTTATPSRLYDFSIYEGSKKAADEGRLLGAINHASGFQAMPQAAAKLDDCKISKITRWVHLGALNN